MMSIKPQIVKEFFRESYAPLWKEVRTGNDCNYMCRAKWEFQQKERIIEYENDIKRGTDRKAILAEKKKDSFEAHHKRWRLSQKPVKPKIPSKSFDHQHFEKRLKEWQKYQQLPKDTAPCEHKFSKFYKIDWEKMHIEMHHSIVTGIREIFTKRKSHGGDTATEFRDDKTYTVSYLQPLGDVINRFLDENKEYRIEMIRYNGANWMDQETSNEASALVVFEVSK